ncbi:MAG: hypothetical protein JOZ53_19470 [Planctomycetaceae bacterium]|nr:hypothetical protein [Planctomycetaceae bacterium]
MSKGIERATRRFRTFAELAKSVRIEKNHEASRDVATSRELSDAERAALFSAPVQGDVDFYARIRRIAAIFGEDRGRAP